MRQVIKIALSGLIVICQVTVKAQLSTDIDITKDAFVETRVGEAAIANTNYGTHALAPAHAWTNGGKYFIRRFIFDVDLSGLPSDAVILSAEIHFFGYGNHYPLSHSNDASLRAFTGSWSETGVTWNNHLTSLTATSDSVYLPSSDSSGSNVADLDYTVDVTNIISQNFDNGQSTTTFRLKLNNEAYYSRLMFCSSDHSDPDQHPFIRVEYVYNDIYYSVYRDSRNNIYSIPENKLKIQVDPDFISQSDTYEFKIMDEDNNEYVSLTSSGITVNNKFLNINTSGLGLVNNKIYSLVLYNEKEEKRYIKFKMY